MKPVDDGLFAHIKESLTEHEEVYSPGAWERFEKKEQRKRFGWLWIASLSTAAAVFLIAFGFFYTKDVDQNKTVLPKQAKAISSLPNAASTGTASNMSPDLAPAQTAVENLKTEVSENKGVVSQRINNNVSNNPIIVVTKPIIVVTKLQDKLPATNTNEGTDASISAVVNTPAVVKTDTKTIVGIRDSVKTGKPLSFEEFLASEVRSNSAVAASKSSAKKADKWELGLMVAPSMGNAKKLNMGYGLSMDYALSDKVSISSGISYNEMAAAKSVGGSSSVQDAPVNMAMVSDTKNLQSVEANLVGIDIPLGIKYRLSKKLYTNVGISAFAVLNQDQNNNYLQGTVEYAASNDYTNANGFKAVFQQQTISEPVPSGEIRGNKYLGFYNVAFGFKQPISESKSFSIEPFMKLPMKEFTKENLYLIGTGLRLKFDF